MYNRELQMGPVFHCTSYMRIRDTLSCLKKSCLRKHMLNAIVWSSMSDAVSMVLQGWDIGPTSPMGPSPWPSWNAKSHGQYFMKIVLGSVLHGPEPLKCTNECRLLFLHSTFILDWLIHLSQSGSQYITVHTELKILLKKEDVRNCCNKNNKNNN